MDMSQWYRIATVVDLTAGTVKGYINGSLAVSTSGTLNQAGWPSLLTATCSCSPTMCTEGGDRKLGP